MPGYMVILSQTWYNICKVDIIQLIDKHAYSGSQVYQVCFTNTVYYTKQIN